MASEVPARARKPVLLGGGIGAGKTSVGEVFADRGFDVIVADRIGHDVLAADQPAVAEVADRWPSAVADGTVDRSALASIVFNDPGELAALEAITHPRIGVRIRELLAAAGERPVVVEVPVLGVLAGLDAVRVAVVADDEVRLARAVARGSTRDDVRARMSSQIDQDDWRAWADIVIDNTGAWADTRRLVEAVIEEVLDG